MPSSKRGGGGGASTAENDINNLGLELPGDSQSLYEVALDVREQTWRKKVVPILITAVLTLWALWAGKRSAPAFFGLPRRAPQLAQYGAAQQSNASAALDPAAIQVLSETAIKKWEKEQLAKQLAEQEKRWKEAFGPQLQALESRLQQEISRKAKEVEGKVVGLQHDLEGLEEKVVEAEETGKTREAALSTLQKDLQHASTQLRRVESEAGQLSKELDKRVNEQLQASEQSAASGTLSPEVMKQLEAMQAQYDELTAKLERVEAEAESLATELELVQAKRLQQAPPQQPAACPAPEASAAAVDAEALRERVVLPEIQRALERESREQAELLRRLQLAQEEAESSRKQLEEERSRFQAEAQTLVREALESSKQQQAEAAGEGGQQQGGGECPGMEEYEKRLTQEVERQLSLFVADDVGMVDHASTRMGSRVVPSLSSPTYTPQGAIIPTDWLHFLGYEHHISPREEVISSKPKRPGDCWPMSGSSGNVTIKLHSPLLPRAVTVQHIHHSISAHKGSAPKTIRVWGRAFPDSAPLQLGQLTYLDGQDKTMQTFRLSPSTREPLQLITFEVLSNYGQQAYTCLYRLRVHGDLPPPEIRP